MATAMDFQFPEQLFPSFYNSGPPDSVLKHNAGNWGCYDQVRPQGGSGPLSSWTFTSRHQVRGETWRHTEPVPVPLLSPKTAVLWPSTPPDPLDFTEHMQNFFMDHCHDAFGWTSKLLDENFSHEKREEGKKCKNSFHLKKAITFVEMLEHKICQQSYTCKSLDAYNALMSDVVHAIPPELLGSLLYEELTEQRDRLLFFEGATGGALDFVPFSQSDGCLLYPGGQGLDCLNFHRVPLQHHRGGSSFVDTSSSEPVRFQLKGPIRQISSTSLLNECCVAVRSDHLCGVWRFSEGNDPRLLQVVNTREVATCISVSPHVLGEVLLVSESGAAKLWTVGRGMQKVREEDHNLYFNAKSSWRWCEFSAHPRVMLYADRTGVELTDIRVNPALCHTLFSIAKTSGCRSGERLILSRYLRDVHSFHHLITTQHSAYIMDERFPSVPMLKWDHMMQSPPMFSQVVPGSTSSGSAVGGERTTKVLLGSHSSQEITLLQYSGGRAEACSSRGPPQALLRPRDSLKHLPVQIPHRLDTATKRLSSPAAGLTCIQNKGGGEASGEECICILQLTEAGDIFYQILESDLPDASRPPVAEEEPSPQNFTQPSLEKAITSERKAGGQLQPDSQLFVSDTSSDEDVIKPTQGLTLQKFVPETPLNMYSESSSEDSESEAKARRRKRLSLQVIVNDQEGGLDEGVNDENDGTKNNNDNTEEPSSVKEMIGGSSSLSHMTPVKLSDSALVTWKQWLQKVVQKKCGNKSNPHSLKHFVISTGSLLQMSKGEGKNATEEERVENVRRDLRACMSKRSLVVHSSVSASLRAPNLEPVPNPVDTEAWSDQLSHRLTVSWQGKEAWQAWWKNELGLNREEKVEALRRKRRREKEAKRASGRRLELSGSFTSSVSYQSQLDDFSDSAGWSSAASRGGWSESEGMESQLDGFVERGMGAAASSSMQMDTPVPTPTTTPQRGKDKHGDQQTPRSSRTFSLTQTSKPESTPTATPQRVKDKKGDQQTPSSSRTFSQTSNHLQAPTPTSQKKNRRPANDYLSSLFAPQDEPSQHDNYFLEEGSSLHPPPPPVASSQLRSSQSVSQRTVRVDLSQDASVLSGFSQSLTQSSQGRLGLSQSSQPKKKKSRMGF